MQQQTPTVFAELPEGGRIEGFCHPDFAAVAEAFIENFRRRGEVGASVAVTYRGQSVIDLWGGLADAGTRQPWQRDTVCIVFSCTKGATALCAHHLAYLGKLDLEAPVAEYWPEFAGAGKQAVTVRMLLDHSAGVPAIRAKIATGGFYDWAYMTELLEAEAPFWEPGTRNGYHGLTFGWTVGEVVRRAAGRSLGSYFRTAIAEPLGLDFWIGLPEAIEPRVAPIIAHNPTPEERETPFLRLALHQPDSIPALFLFNSGGFMRGGHNTRDGHVAEIGAANGITNGRGLAGMYAPLALGGSRDGVRVTDADGLLRMSEVAMASHCDANLQIPTRFSLGFMKSMDNRRRDGGSESVILGAQAFGHVGAGGSIGFADPECGLSFGYAMNRMGPGLLLNPRGQTLVDAAYRSLGYSGSMGGVWRR